jgi:hypothetical protein
MKNRKDYFANINLYAFVLNDFMKLWLLGFYVMGAILLSSCEGSKPKEKDIYPLHPYRSILDFKDSIGNFTSRSIIDYYVVYGDASDTNYMKKLLIEYATRRFDSTVMKFPLYYNIEFYKRSSKTNKEYRESHSDLIDYHVKDHFATIHFVNGGNHWILFDRN